MYFTTTNEMVQLVLDHLQQTSHQLQVDTTTTQSNNTAPGIAFEHRRCYSLLWLAFVFRWSVTGLSFFLYSDHPSPSRESTTSLLHHTKSLQVKSHLILSYHGRQELSSG